MLLTIIAGTGLPMSPNRTPTSHYVHVSTPYGQYNTRAIQAVMADCSVSWNQTLNIHERPQTFFKRLMSIFKSKAVHLEIRALYELDQYEVVCAFDTTFEQLLAEHTLHSDDNNQRISLKLKAGDTNESVVNGQPASSRKYDTHTREKNVVIFGETGSGKSSIINVVAQEQIAKTSNDAPGCTSEFKRYSVDISGQKFALFDTAGLNEGSAGTVPHKRAKKQLKGLLNKLMSHKSPSGGIDLLVYCVQNTAAPRAILNTYNTVYSGTCRKKRVPVVVVVTGLESMSPMESWWDTHKEIFNSMDLAGHACVTTVQEYPDIPEEYIHRVAQSSKILRDLVMNTASAADDNLPAGTWCWSPSWSMA